MTKASISLGNYYRFLRSYLFAKCTYLIFFVTSKCNSRCRMCFYWQDIEKANDKRPLSAQEIDLIASHFRDLAYLSITGGEPVLRDDLDDIAGSFYKHSGARFINFTTNGLLPARTAEIVGRILKRCPKANLKVNLSIDDIGARNDEIRGVAGSFDNALDTFSRLRGIKERDRRLSLLITTVLSAYNKDTIFDIIDYVARKIRPDAHSVALVRGDTREDGAKGVSLERYGEAIEHLAASSGGKKGFMQKALERMMRFNLEALKRGDIALPCVAGGKMLTMTDEGDIIPCEVISAISGGRDFSMGKLREYGYDIQKLLDSDKAKGAVDFIRSSKCRCSFECAALWNIAFNPIRYSAILARGA